MTALSKNSKTMRSPNSVTQDAVTIALAAASILLLPLLAMQFSKEANWSMFDFVAAWILLFSAGFTYKLIVRKANNNLYKAASFIAVGTALFLVWSNLAVGIIGSEDNPENMMYFGVLAVGFIGSLIARFQPKGMSYSLYAASTAQAIITVIMLFLGMQHVPGSSVAEILGINLFFIVLWFGSALLYRHAAEQPPANTAPER